MNETKISAFEQAVHAVNPEAEMPTLKAVAAAMDIPYPRLSAVSKQPEEGMVYDRNAFNWFAISRFLTRRLDPETLQLWKRSQLEPLSSMMSLRLRMAVVLLLLVSRPSHLRTELRSLLVSITSRSVIPPPLKRMSPARYTK